jgi:hypothetical protein
MYLTATNVDTNEGLWRAGEIPKRAYLVDDATVTMRGPEGELKPFTTGAFVCEVDPVRTNGPAASSARVTQKGRLFFMERDDLVRFFEDNPGVYLSFLGTRFVE